MTENRTTAKSTSRNLDYSTRLAGSYYALLGLHPSASAIEIRRVYRELSKRYHPDTTELSQELAKEKFQALNEAYATLSNPERRLLYDYKIGYSRVNVIQASASIKTTANTETAHWSNSAYLDPQDRPLSAGEVFALFILGITFLGCLLLALVIGLTRGDSTLQVPQTRSNYYQQVSQITQQKPVLLANCQVFSL